MKYNSSVPMVPVHSVLNSNTPRFQGTSYNTRSFELCGNNRKKKLLLSANINRH